MMKHYLYECTDPDSECDGEEFLVGANDRKEARQKRVVSMNIEDFIQPESGDVIILRFNPEEYDMSQVKAIFDCVKNAFPSNNIITMPAGVSFSIMDRETCLSFLQKTIEEIKE